MDMDLGRLLIVDDDRSFAGELKNDGQRLGLDVQVVHDTSTFEQVLKDAVYHRDGLGDAGLRWP